MRYIKQITAAFMALSILTGCDMNEEPQSQASVDMVFASETGLKRYSYSFYSQLPDNNAAARRDATSDICARNQLSGMEIGAYTTVSASSWSWTGLRNINFFLAHNTDSRVSATIRNHYNGIARCFRAYYYGEKLYTYGEVPWIDKVFNEINDPGLMAKRDTRDCIIKHIIEDLDYAYENITTTKPTVASSTINRWTALAIKARILLYEASLRKYYAGTEYTRNGCSEYTPDMLFKMAANAVKELMDKGPYKLYTSKSYANGRGSYRELFTAEDAVTSEVMLAVALDPTLRLGSQNWYYNSPTYGAKLSMTRKFAKTYLNIDGTPYNELNADGTYKEFKQETTGRDQRLNQTIRAYDYTRTNGQIANDPTTADFATCLTGYMYTKYVSDDSKIDNGNNNTNDIPLIRYAEMLLIYAEAKAELGTLTDEDWAKTVGALRKRAGITGGTAETGTLTTRPTKAEPYIASYYPNITDPSMLEIRRERACELVLEGQRLRDLKRWNAMSLYVNDPWEGIFIPDVNTPVDLNGDGKADAYFYTTASAPSEYKSIGVNVADSKSFLRANNVDGGYILQWTLGGRNWPARQLLNPIPQIVRQKNPDLTQNPGWED